MTTLAKPSDNIAYAYLSGVDGCDAPKTVTDWNGAILGTVINSKRYKLTRFSYTHGSTIYSVQVKDLDGGRWYGRGNKGICVTLRRYKGS